MEAINTLAVPVVTYSFNIINWKMSEIRSMDAKTRKLLTMYKMHHPRADTERLYIPRNRGGRGLLQLEMNLKSSTIGLCEYLHETNDPLLEIAKGHDENKKLFSIKKEANKYKRELDIHEQVATETTEITNRARKTKQQAKNQCLKQLETLWKEKLLNGKYHHS